MEPVDSLGFIGRNPRDEENVYIATGDSGNGMTHGTIASMLITDLIQGRDNAWQALYDPSRKTLKAAPSFVAENANAVGQMVKDWGRPREVDDADTLGGVYASGMHRAMESRREKLGLSLPRLALRLRGAHSERPDDQTARTRCGGTMTFNPKSTVKVAGHPIHPMLIPFPIAFFVATFAADLAFWQTSNPAWAIATVWLLSAGLVMAALAAVAGLTDVLVDWSWPVSPEWGLNTSILKTP